MELDARPPIPVTPLVVADWRIDAEAVAVTCRQRLAGDCRLRIVVPAWLHGLDWAGDPFASVPCAEGQLDRLSRLCSDSGFRVISAEVGDPDPLSAICDALDNRTVPEILFFGRGRHVAAGYPFGVAARAERLTGLAVRCFNVRSMPRPPRRRRFAAGHCEAT
jgi:hypothetical protein